MKCLEGTQIFMHWIHLYSKQLWFTHQGVFCCVRRNLAVHKSLYYFYWTKKFIDNKKIQFGEFGLPSYSEGDKSNARFIEIFL